MLHGASDGQTLIVNGCTSVHPYNLDGNHVHEKAMVAAMAIMARPRKA